jgi:transcriptional regulator with XRE-family HTH domain
MERHDLSLRGLAELAGVNPMFLSKVLRGAEGKTASPQMAEKVAAALGLPPYYFPEARRGWVMDRLHDDPKLIEHLFDDLYRT